MTSPSGRQIVMRCDNLELVAAEVGGGIRSCILAGREILDGYPEDEMCSAGRGQVLAPWPNRLGDGVYQWNGRDCQTALTEPEHRNAIHGLVRWSTWSVVDQGTDHARLELRLYPQPGWAWTLDLAVEYRLSTHGFEVVTRVTNVDDNPCPFGLGWHPYVAAFGGVVDGIRLTVPAEMAYHSDDRGLPIGRFAVEGTEVDFRTPRVIGPARLDVALTGLDRDAGGRATVELVAGGLATGDAGDAAVRIWMDSSYTHVMVYSGDTVAEPERRRRGLAVEPMTCAPDMLRSGDGRRVLEPGQTFEAAWGLDVFGFSFP